MHLVKPLNRNELGCLKDLPILSNASPDALNLRIGQNKEAHLSELIKVLRYNDRVT